MPSLINVLRRRAVGMLPRCSRVRASDILAIAQFTLVAGVMAMGASKQPYRSSWSCRIVDLSIQRRPGKSRLRRMGQQCYKRAHLPETSSISGRN